MTGPMTKIVLPDGSSKSNVRAPHSSSCGARRTVHLGAPLAVIGIRVVYLERDAGISTVAIHGTVEGQLDSSALEAEESGVAVLGGFEDDAKAEAIDVEGIRRG